MEKDTSEFSKATEVLQTLAEVSLDPRRSRRDERRARQELAGIPESRTFNDPETAGGPNKMEKYHINGVLIAELNLRPEVLAALDYWCTDEGMKEKNSRPDVREPSGITPGRDEFSLALDQRRDEVKQRDFPLYVAKDPLGEVAKKFVRPGFRPKFLSSGSGDSTGDHEVVKYPDNHPRHGEVVKVKGMILGEIPEDLAKARNEHFRSRGNAMLGMIELKHKAEGGSVDK